MMVIGFAVSWLFYIRRPYLPVELANQHQLLYRFLLNKWYFDELYDFLFVGPQNGSARRSGRRATASSSTVSDRTASPRACST